MIHSLGVHAFLFSSQYEDPHVMCYLVLSCHIHPHHIRSCLSFFLWSTKMMEDVRKKTDRLLVKR